MCNRVWQQKIRGSRRFMTWSKKAEKGEIPQNHWSRTKTLLKSALRLICKSWLPFSEKKMHFGDFDWQLVLVTCCTWGCLVSTELRVGFLRLPRSRIHLYSMLSSRPPIPVKRLMHQINDNQTPLLCDMRALTRFNQTFVVRICSFSFWNRQLGWDFIWWWDEDGVWCLQQWREPRPEFQYCVYTNQRANINTSSNLASAVFFGSCEGE